MSTIEAQVELPVPLGTAYDVLQDLSALPVLFETIVDARPLHNMTLVLAEVDGKEHAWEAQLVDESPGRHLTWDRSDGPGSVELRFRPAGPRGTRLTALVYEVEDEEHGLRLLERELAHLQHAIAAWAQPTHTSWGVAGPW